MSDRLHCIRGCVRRGMHLPDCEGDDCAGCLPRSAAVGQLCLGCHGRLAESIGRIPELITLIRAHVQPGAVRRDGMVQGTRTPPAPLALDAVDAADGLYSSLSSWHDTATDELDLTPLRVRGWSKTSDHGQITGLRAGALGNDAVVLAERLTTHLDRVCVYEWVGDMVTEISDVVRSARSRWPDEERPMYLPTPCPRCDMLTLVRHAPSAFLGVVTIACKRGECGEVVAEEKYGLLTRMVLDEQRTKQEAEEAA